MLAIVQIEIRAAEAIDPSTVSLETNVFRHMAEIWLGTILNAGAVFRSFIEQMRQPPLPILEIREPHRPSVKRGKHRKKRK